MARALTFDELKALWVSVTDEGYHRPLLERADSGVEVIEQAFAQYERASIMVNRTMQAMFIRPWSGQTDEPASGGKKATVRLRFDRTARSSVALLFTTDLLIEHLQTDYSPDGPIEVPSGRRFVIKTPGVLMPGAGGPLYVDAEAEQTGYGYNVPMVGSLRRIEQLGIGAANVAASVIVSGGSSWLRLGPQPDVLAPSCVGHYVLFTGGANAGQIRRVTGYTGPVPGVTGGEVLLAAEWVLAGTFTGTPVVGDMATCSSGTAWVLGVLAGSPDRVLLTYRSGTMTTGAVTFSSGATMAVSVVEQSAMLLPETDTASWQLMSWDVALGVSVTNEDQPAGGRSPMLDELGGERAVYRSPGEDDESYRERVVNPADTISPNALYRAGNAALAPYGLTMCLREVGRPEFPGLFYDAGSSRDAVQDPARNFAYDLDFAARPSDRFKLALARATFRAFFLVGVPQVLTGQTGVPWDATNLGLVNAYGMAFYGGTNADEDARIYKAVYNALEPIKAGGVGFALYLENIGCP